MLCCIYSLLTLPLKLVGFAFSTCGFIVLVSLAVGSYLLRIWCRGGRCRSRARLDGKTAIITGANSGIGKETARDFIRRGARVVMACRDMDRAEMAAAEIRCCATKDGAVVVKKLDLASLTSVRDFCDDINKNEPQVHLLINNAGVMMCPEWKTQEGFEMQFGTNHLGHFLLSNLLLDKMKSSAPARVVNLSSRAHNRGEIRFDNISLSGEYDSWGSYRQSKLANVLFNRELAKRLRGSGVSAFAVHPGVVKTNLGHHLMATKPWLQHVLAPIAPIVFKNAEEGAQTSIHCAVQEGIENQSGSYFSDCRVTEESAQARDDGDAEKLWRLSEKMTGLSK